MYIKYIYKLYKDFAGVEFEKKPSPFPLQTVPVCLRRGESKMWSFNFY